MEILALSNFQVTPYGGLAEATELNFRNLYLRRVLQQPDQNQETIIAKPAGMGETAVNNWAIYDGRQSNAKRVARAKGMHMKADGWYNSFVIVFDGERFNGSTLQVVGVTDLDDNLDAEWGIVGGTGEFAMARGVIKRTFYREFVDNLTIHAFCLPRSFPSIDNKQGPWGAQGDPNGDYQEGQEPRRLLSVTVHSGFVIDALEFSYVDQTGIDRTLGPWGGTGGHSTTITLGASDLIKNISGTTDRINGRNVITSLTIFTNNHEKTYEFGRPQGTSFGSDLPTTSYVTCFSGNFSSKYLESIAVYYA